MEILMDPCCHGKKDFLGYISITFCSQCLAVRPNLLDYTQENAHTNTSPDGRHPRLYLRRQPVRSCPSGPVFACTFSCNSNPRVSL